MAVRLRSYGSGAPIREENGRPGAKQLQSSFQSVAKPSGKDRRECGFWGMVEHMGQESGEVKVCARKVKVYMNIAIPTDGFVAHF
jgi:hypothetical protein